MLKSIFLIWPALLTVSLSYGQQDTGTFIDARDGQVYIWVSIGSQTWMAQNLNIESITKEYPNNTFEESYIRRCYKNKADNCMVYGGLYTEKVINFYAKAYGPRNICPKGWHLPSENEWFTLINYLGGQEAAGDAMKESGTIHWKGHNKGATNSSGFNALPGGFCFYDDDRDSYFSKGDRAAFWTSTRSYSTDWFCTLFLLKDKSKVFENNSHGYSALSVRCLKDKRK
jgi:uncharacterized protein (TIGR02145 family)